MNQPRVYMCSPSWTPLPPPSPSHPSGSSQCTSPEHPVSCIEPGLVISFTYDNIHVSMLFSQIIPPSPSLTESNSLFFTSVSLLLCSLLIVVDPVMQNNNSNKIRKQHCRILGGAEGFVPILLYMKILLPHTQKASWGRTACRIPASLVRKLQLQFNRHQAQPSPQGKHPIRGQRSGPEWVFHTPFIQLLQFFA